MCVSSNSIAVFPFKICNSNINDYNPMCHLSILGLMSDVIILNFSPTIFKNSDANNTNSGSSQALKTSANLSLLFNQFNFSP